MCFLTCVTVEMCKVCKAGAGACVHAGRGGEDVSSQVTEKVKPLVVDMLLLLLLVVDLTAARHRRLVGTRNAYEPTAI